MRLTNGGRVGYNGGEVMGMDADYHINKSYLSEPLACGDVHLVQIGRLFFRGAGAVAEHLHRGWFELTAVSGGTGQVTLGSERVTVTAGDICLSLPAEVHKIESSAEDPLRYDFFSFYCDEPEMAEALAAMAGRLRSAERRILSDDKIRTLIGVAIAELENEGAPFSHRLLSHLLSEIVIRLLRAAGGVADTPSPLPSAATRLCFRVQQYMDTHVFTLRSLSEVAAVFGYNYSYLSALFRRTTGTTLRDYHRTARWRVARLLVQENRTKITEIAEMLGYSSVYVFSRAYRARFGVPPSRDRVRKE